MNVSPTMLPKLAVVFTAAVSIMLISIPGTHSNVLNRHARAAMMIDMRGFPDPGNLCARGATFYRNVTDCTQFYRCVDFHYNGKHTVFRFMCGPMAVFDESSGLCVGPSLAKPPCPADQLPPMMPMTSTSEPVRPTQTFPTPPTPSTPSTPSTPTPDTATPPTSSTSPKPPPPMPDPGPSSTSIPAPTIPATSPTPPTPPTSPTPEPPILTTSSVPPTPSTPTTPITLESSTPPTVEPPPPTPASPTLPTPSPSVTPEIPTSPPPPRPKPDSIINMLIGIIRVEYELPNGERSTELIVPDNVQDILSNTITRPSVYVQTVGTFTQTLSLSYTTSTVVIRPTPIPAGAPAFPTEPIGGEAFAFTQGATSYTVTLPPTYVPADSKYIDPSKPVPIAITTTVVEAFGTTTTTFGQNLGPGLEPSEPTLEGVVSTVGTPVFNVNDDVTVITETQLIKPTVTVVSGVTSTFYSTVRVTRTVVPTRITQIIRPTTVINNNQIIISTAYQTLTLRPLISGVTYYYTQAVTVINGQTVTQTLTEFLRPTDASPIPVPPYTTTTVLEPTTVTVEGEVITANVIETVALNPNYIVPTIEPSQPPAPATVTYINPTIFQSLGQLVTSTIYRVTTLRPYLPTFATITRFSVVTVSGQLQTTTYIQTVTLPPPAPITTIIRPTTTLSGVSVITTTTAATFFTDPLTSQGNGDSSYEIESSKVDGITGDIYNVFIGPTGAVTSQVVSGESIRKGVTLLVTYIQRLTLRPQASTVYRTLTVTKNGSPVTITAQQTIQGSAVTNTVLQTTRVLVNSDNQLIIEGQTVVIPVPSTTVVALEPTTVTVNGQVVTETIVETLTLPVDAIIEPSIDPALPVAPITLTYLNPEIVSNQGEIVTVPVSSPVPVWPYRPTVATYVKPVVVTQFGQVQTVTRVHTVTLRPTLQVTSIIRPTSTLINGLNVQTSVVETYGIEPQDPQRESGLYELEGSQVVDLVGEINSLEVVNGIQSFRPISQGEIRPGSWLWVTYVKWLTLRPQVSTVYRPITVTQNRQTVTLTALQTIQGTPITSSFLVPTTLQINDNNELVIEDKTFSFKQELLGTSTEIYTTTDYVDGTPVVQIITSVIIYPIETTSTLTVDIPYVTVIVPGETVTVTSEQTVIDEQTITITSVIEGSISTVVESIFTTEATPPLTQTVQLPDSSPLTTLPVYGQQTKTVFDGATTYIATGPFFHSEYVQPGKTPNVLLTTSVVQVSGAVVTTIYGQNVGVGLDSSGPIIGGTGLIVGQSADVQQGITTITETQLIKPSEVVLSNGQRTTVYSTVRVTRTLAPSRITTIPRPTTVFAQGQLVTNTIFQTVTYRPVIPSVTYIVYGSTVFNSGQQTVSTVTELVTSTEIVTPPVQPAIVETVFNTDTYFIDGQWVTASILETVTLDGSFEVVEPTQTFPPATATTLTYLNPSAVILNGLLSNSTLYQTLTLRPFLATSVKYLQLSTVLVGGQLVTRTVTRTVTRAPTAGYLTTVVKPAGGAITRTETYVIEPTEVSSQGDITEVIDASVIQYGPEFTNLVYGPDGALQSSQPIEPSQIRPGYILSFLYWHLLTLRPLRAPVPRPTTIFQNGQQVTVTLWQTLPAVTEVSTVIQPAVATVNENGAVWLEGQWVTLNTGFFTSTITGEVTTITDSYIEETIINTVTTTIGSTEVIEIQTTINLVPATADVFTSTIVDINAITTILPPILTGVPIPSTIITSTIAINPEITSTTVLISEITTPTAITSAITSTVIINPSPAPISSPDLITNLENFTATPPPMVTPGPLRPTTSGTRPPTQSPGTTFQLRCGSDVLRRFPLDCSRFYQCLGEGDAQTIYVFACIAGTIFDEKTQQCKLPADTQPCYDDPIEEEDFRRSRPQLDSREGMVEVTMEKLHEVMEASKADHPFPQNVPLGPVALAQYLDSTKSDVATEPVEQANTQPEVAIAGDRFHSGSYCDNPHHYHEVGSVKFVQESQRPKSRLTPNQRLSQFDFGRRLTPRMRVHF